MKRTALLLIALFMVAGQALKAQEETVKTGLSYGPLPAISFDADKGFQYGALLQLYNFGDGSSYPNYKSKWYFEASWFTKGSKQFQIMYDKFDIFPGVRFCASAKYLLDSAFDFYGLNGYSAYYDATGETFRQSLPLVGLTGSAEAPFHPFYRVKRNMLMARADFLGNITEHLQWAAGYHFTNFDMGTIDYESINKGKDDAQKYPETYGTLIDYYTLWGIIPEEEKNGGIYSCIRAGLTYDTRDKEGAPASGIWADAHINLAPKWLGSSSSSYRYSLTWRQYFPIIGNDVLTFAYRFNYEGTFGDHCPYYLLPFVSVIGSDNDVEGMGGSKTTRGIMRARSIGLDTGLYTAELRWRFVQFQAFNQNIAFGLNLFSDGSMVFRPYNTDFHATVENAATKPLYDAFVTNEKDVPHITVGTGLRFIMNQNFIVAMDYGTPITHYMKNSPHYNQDGSGALYIGLGYLF